MTVVRKSGVRWVTNPFRALLSAKYGTVTCSAKKLLHVPASVASLGAASDLKSLQSMRSATSSTDFDDVLHEARRTEQTSPRTLRTSTNLP